jgi:autotransporter-associated beta strand protein
MKKIFTSIKSKIPLFVLYITIVVLLCVSPFLKISAQTSVLWSSATGQPWLTATNWTGNVVPGTTDNAQFGVNPTSGTTGVGINMNGATNNGANNQAVGAIEITSARTANHVVGNSSTTAAGTLTLNGFLLNSVANTIIRNNASVTLTIQNTQGAGSQTMDLALGNATDNVVNVDGTGNVVITSNITGSGRKLTLNANSSGDLRLSGSNTFTGGITINGGTAGGRLRIDGLNALPTTGSIAINTGGRLTLNVAGTYGTVGQVLSFNPNQTTNPSLDILNNAAVVWQGNVNLAADTRIEASGASGSITFSGNLSGAGTLIKQAAGNLILSGTGNTATGGTYIGNGTVIVNSGSLLGTGPLTMYQTSTNNTSLVLNNTAQTIGTLTSNFTAVTGTQTQVITLNGTALTINQTSNTSYGTGAVATLTSTITGTGSVIKTGASNLTLSGANTYSGGTTITNGTLILGATNVLNATGSIRLNGGSLSTGSTTGNTNTVGTLNLSATSSVALGTGAHTLTFANSSAVIWNGAATLTITGWTGTGGASGTGGKIFFGNTSSGLTASQLAQISFSGFPGTPILLSTGELVPPAVPTVTLNAPSSITVTTASSGGNVTADGGNAVSVKGVVWGTASNPTVPSVNATSDGTGTGSYSSAVSGLSAQTLYYIRAYATSAAGTGYSAQQTFRTLSAVPTAQAANLVAVATAYNQVELSWDPASFPVSGATVKGYVILRASGATPTFTASNGSAPTAGVGTIITSAVYDPDNSYIDNSVSQNTAYTYLLIPYCWDGVNAATYNYLISGALTASATTPLGPCIPPVTQATAATVSGATASTLNISWAAGSGDRSIVIVRASNPVSEAPESGTAYTASAVFGAGFNLGSSNFVCYNGTGTSFTVTNLSASTTYYVAVYTYNVSGYCFNLSSPATGSGTTLVAPSVIETFEPGTKNTYTTGDDVCALGTWRFSDALVGQIPGSDRFNGTRSARIQNNGTITMQFDKTNGLGTISIRHAVFGSDGNSTWRMDVSNNGGADFTAYQSPVQTSSSTALNTVSFTPNITGNNIRVRIVKLSGGSNRINIDDISLGDYVSSNTVTTSVISGSPFCVTSASGITVNVPFTSSGVFNTGNVYTVQLSDAAGSFANPVDIGTLTSTANSGTITATIPAGTATGTAYKIRVVASTPSITGSASSSILTVINNTPEVSGLYTNAASGSAAIGWSNPAGCYNQVVVFASTSSITCTPSGDGSAYTANTVYGSGTACSSAFAIYKGTGNTVTITGLTNGTTYYIKAFVRNGTTWSEGVQITVVPNTAQDGDYRSITSGLWSSASTWEKRVSGVWQAGVEAPNWSGSSGDIPPATANVTVRSGHTVTVETASANAATNHPIGNLTIESGATLVGNGTGSNNTYVTVYGNITCNGTIGTGSSTWNSISFNVEGANSTISGTGTFNASRIRKSFIGNTTTNLTIAMNVNLLFGTSSGTTIYNNKDGTTFNMTVNENSILSCITTSSTSGNASINGVTGTAGNRAGTFTINGTMNIPGILYATSNNNNTGRLCQWIIGTAGVINCNQINCNASGAGGHKITILNGGRLNINTNTGFDVSNFSTTNNTYDFQPGSIVEYSAVSGITPILTDLTYSNLIVSGSGTNNLLRSDGSTTGLTLTVNKDLTITGSSTLDVSPANTIQIGGNWNNYSTAGFNEATGTVVFNGFSGAQKITCPGGENFYTVIISNSGSGVQLNTDATIANILNLGSAGKLYFGPTPSVVRLTNMAASSNSFQGSGSAVVDMSASAGRLYIGCQSPSYSGTFNAGSLSLVDYNRDNALSGSGGAQSILTGISYANLSCSGSDTKTVFNDLTVNGNLTIDGAGTNLSTAVAGRTLVLAGNLTLSGGGSMNANCLSNLTITTSGNNTQIFSGGFNPINCYNLNTNKTAGGITLESGAATVLNVNNALTQLNASLLTANDNRLRLGNTWSLPGASSFIFGTSTVEWYGAGSQTIIPINYYNLESSSTGVRVMSSTGSVGIAGSFTKGTNSYTFTNSTVNYFGSGAQNITPFVSGTLPGATYNNLTLSGSGIKTLVGNTDVEGDLALNNSITLSLSDYFLNLKSTATKTARVAPVSASATITYPGAGRFVVERYYPPKRSWRLITAPVSVDGSKSVFNSWQVGGVNNLTGSGTYVTGPSETVANGLDISPQHNYSLKVFNPATSQFDGVGNTKTTLISGTAGTAGVPDNTGFFMFVRGDRTPANIDAFNPSGTVVETTLRDTGKVQIKTYNFSCNNNTGTHRYTLIGNPYASPVDFTSLGRSGVANKFWAWDPNLNTVGGYVIVDLSLGTITTVPSGGSTTQTQILQSKQAFLVETTSASSPTVTFTEAAKSSLNNLNLFRPAPFKKTPSLSVNLQVVNADGTVNTIDGVLAQFDKTFADTTDYLDALRFSNINETFSIVHNRVHYMLERRQPVRAYDTIYLNLSRVRPLNYRLSIDADIVADISLRAYLEDTLLKNITPLQLNGNSTFDFSINNSTPAAPGRFRIIFRKLPRIKNLFASIVQPNMELKWEVEDEAGIDGYWIERSADGKVFEKLFYKSSGTDKAAIMAYQWYQNDLLPGRYFYRVSSTDIYGNQIISKLVSVIVPAQQSLLFVYPNPVKGGRISVYHSAANGFSKNYMVRLIDNAGRPVVQQDIKASLLTTSFAIVYPRSVTPGMYNLECFDGVNKQVIPVVIAE